MMESTKNPDGKMVPAIFTMIILIFSTLQQISAQQQISTFTLAGWTPGVTPIFTGTGSNVTTLHYGDSLNTSLSFNGAPDDGLGTDNDNIANVNFSYSYTVYLTHAGQAFSSASIAVGTHTFSANQQCSSGIVPPWTISLDNNATIDTNAINLNIADGINDCIPAGNYQVDIVFDKYSQSSVGPSPQPMLLEWMGYTNNSARGLTTLTPPSSENVSDSTLSPVTSYLLSRIGFIRVAQPSSCPSITLNLPEEIQTFATSSSVTVAANYPGYCPQNAFTYRWSNGERTSTVNLSKGSYTVTVTAPCGTTASATVLITNITDPNISEVTASTQTQTTRTADNVNAPGNKTFKSATDNSSNGNIEAHINLYPNPAKHNITFDLTNASISTYSIRILDMLGNEVMQPNNIATESNKLDVNVDELPAGSYLYEVVLDQTYRGKFIKQ